MMITKAVREYEREHDLVTYIVPIEDLNRNSVWVSHVQSMSPSFDVAYSNNPLVIQLVRGGRYRGAPVQHVRARPPGGQ